MKNTRIIIFSIGAFGYGLIEVLWRGHTHWSMLGAGGLSFLGLTEIQNRMKNASILLKGLLGGFLITAIEFVFGCVFNIILKKDVWDYSKMPLNIKGQICPLFTFFWILLSMIFIPFGALINKILQGKTSLKKG